jgi:hypothetical protein
MKKMNSLSTMEIYAIGGFVMFGSMLILYFISKLFFGGQASNLLVAILISWLAFIVNLLGVVSIWKREIPSFPAAKYITGNTAVILGSLTIAIGIAIQIVTILSLLGILH